MITFRRLVCVAVCLVSTACGGADPDVRTADWEENFTRVNQASAAGEHDRAIAISEAFLEKYPDNVDGHLMIAGALEDAGKAASDASRPARFERAVQHYARVLELTKNSLFRGLAISHLVQLHTIRGLNNPEEAMRYARMQIEDNPKDLNSYSLLFYVLREAKRYDEATSLIAEAKKTAEPTADTLLAYSDLLYDLVVSEQEFPREKGRALLAETTAEIDQGLSRFGQTAKLLERKGMLLQAQARLEPDPARQQSLQDEARRLFEASDRVAK